MVRGLVTILVLVVLSHNLRNRWIEKIDRLKIDRQIARWMDGWMDGWTDGWMDGQRDGWIDRQIDGANDFRFYLS